MFGSELSPHSSTPPSPNQPLPRSMCDIMGSWVCGLGDLIKSSNDDLKMSPYCWQEPQIYKWLLKVCDKHSKLKGLQVANLQPFIANFHSGAFGQLDPELRDIIALEHRKLFDDLQGLQLDASSDSDYSTGVSPAPSTTGVLGGSSEDLTGPTTGPSGCVRMPCMGIDEPYPPSASPDSGSERISGNGSPSGYIEQPSDLYCTGDSLSPTHHMPPPPHTTELWNPVHTTTTQGMIASMHGPSQMVWPQTDPSLFPPTHAQPMHNYPPVALQMAPHDFQPSCISQFPPFCLSSPAPTHLPFPETLGLPPHSHHLPSQIACSPGGIDPPKPKRPKKAHKKKGQGRNQTDKVVDTRILESMPSSVQLWEFVLRVLKNPLYNNILSWENQHDGIFHIHDPQALAELWGKHRNHEGMNYDKMSRAMRYYYRRGILEPVRERLTYKFALRLRPMFFD